MRNFAAMRISRFAKDSALLSLALARQMADSVAERLRAFVRERVRREAAKYERGTAARLNAYLKRPPSWVSEYTDDPPIRHADVDTAIAICRFFRVELSDFQRAAAPVPRPAAPSPSKSASTASPTAATKLGQRILRLPKELRQSVLTAVDAYEQLASGTQPGVEAATRIEHQEEQTGTTREPRPRWRGQPRGKSR